MKKIFVFITVVFLFILAGCSGKNESQTESASSAPAFTVEEAIHTPVDVIERFKPYAQKNGINHIKTMDSVLPGMILIRDNSGKEYKVMCIGEYPSLKFDKIAPLAKGEWDVHKRFGESILVDMKEYVNDNLKSYDFYLKVSGKTLKTKKLDDVNPYLYTILATYSDASVYRFAFLNASDKITPLGKGYEVKLQSSALQGSSPD